MLVSDLFTLCLPLNVCVCDAPCDGAAAALCRAYAGTLA